MCIAYDKTEDVTLLGNCTEGASLGWQRDPAINDAPAGARPVCARAHAPAGRRLRDTRFTAVRAGTTRARRGEVLCSILVMSIISSPSCESSSATLFVLFLSACQAERLCQSSWSANRRRRNKLRPNRLFRVHPWYSCCIALDCCQHTQSTSIRIPALSQCQCPFEAEVSACGYGDEIFRSSRPLVGSLHASALREYARMARLMNRRCLLSGRHSVYRDTFRNCTMVMLFWLWSRRLVCLLLLFNTVRWRCWKLHSTLQVSPSSSL